MMTVFALALTLVIFIIARTIYLKSNCMTLLSPPIVAISGIVAVLLFLDISYDEYFEGAKWIHYLLGPATVSFAIPLYGQFQRLKENLLPISISLLTGSVAGVLLGVYGGLLWGLSSELRLSLAPKSVTTPIAMALSEQIGGRQEVTVLIVIFTGVFAALCAPWVFKVFRIRSFEAQGFALGLAAHGLGVYQAFQINERAAAFASLGMALNGVLTALIIQFLIPLFP